MVADVINFILEGLVAAINALLSIFPDSPFRASIETMQSRLGSQLLGYINYFLPVSEMLAILATWIVAISLYYVVSVILRWVKAIA